MGNDWPGSELARLSCEPDLFLPPIAIGDDRATEASHANSSDSSSASSD